jgi:hypothetical protein
MRHLPSILKTPLKEKTATRRDGRPSQERSTPVPAPAEQGNAAVQMREIRCRPAAEMQPRADDEGATARCEVALRGFAAIRAG